MQRRFFWLCVPAVVACLAMLGCPAVEQIIDDGDGDSPAAEGGATITVTAPASATTVSLGTPVQIRWTVSSLPNAATVDLAWKISGQTSTTKIVSDLAVNAQGSFSFDTSELTIGFKYIIVATLKSNGTVVSTANSAGAITIAKPMISVSAPTDDLTLLPSGSMAVKWTGDYPPIGGRLEVFLDLDRSYQNGNELAVSSDVVTEQSTSQSGTVTVTTATLLNTPSFQRGQFYFVGVRLMKGTSLVNAAYAPASVRAYDGDRFAVVEPAEDVNILIGNKVSVIWNPSGVPTALKVAVLFEDVDSGDRVTAASNVAVDTGRALASTSGLQPLHTYNVIVQLKDGADLVTELVAGGQVYATGWGSTIEVGLGDDTDMQFVGLGGTIDIMWDVTWGVGPSQESSVVKLYLDEDGVWSTTDDQIEITPNGGVDPELGQYAFAPTVADDSDLAGKDYYVFAELVMVGPHAVSQSANLLHVGEGCVELTDPATDVEKSLGDTVTAEWVLLGDPCTHLPDADIELKVYVDTVQEYKSATAKLVSSSTTKLRPCTTSQLTFTVTDEFDLGETYYVIARLFVDGVEADRSVSEGGIIVPTATFSVSEPAEDVSTGLNNITVEWTLSGIPTAGRFVRVKAVAQTGSLVGDELTISGDEPAANSSTTADASKLRPGTYGVRCYLMTTDADGNDLVLMQADATGRLVLSDGYNGTYDLLDMQNGPTAGFSPIDGVIFNGFHTADGAGYRVASLGDINTDGYGDFMIFSRYGQLYTAGKAGAGYLIYGGFRTTGQPSEDETMIFEFPLNNIPSTLNPKLQVAGTVMALPVDNSAVNTGGVISGDYIVTDLPDISQDGRADMLIGCPTAAPLAVTYENYADEQVTFTDPYGIVRTLEPVGKRGSMMDEPMHVMYPGFTLTVRADEWTVNKDTNVITGSNVVWQDLDYAYMVDYSVGDTLQVQFYKQIVSFCTTSGDESTRVRFPRIVTVLPAHTTINVVSASGVGPYVPADAPALIEAGWTAAGSERGSASIVTSDTLTNANLLESYFYRNPTVDPAWGSALQPIYDLNHILGTPISCPTFRASSNSMSYIMDTPNTNFGEGISVIPDAFGVEHPQLLIASPKANVIDFSDPAFTARLGAGLISIVESWNRPTSISRALDTPMGALRWVNSTSSLPSIAAMIILGPEAGAELGPSVSFGHYDSANNRSVDHYVGGDFNGDGMGDFVVSAPLEHAGGLANSGAIYVIQGNPIIGFRVPLLDLADFNIAMPPGASSDLEVPVMGWKITGSAANMELGTELASAGDFNGDGLEDFVIVQPNAANTGGDAQAGKIIIIFGGDYDLGEYSIADAGGEEADDIQSLTFEGEAANDHFGSEIKGIYDVNQDGLNDILVSAPDADPSGRAGAGKVYLIYGRSIAVKTNPATDKRYVDYDDDGVADADPYDVADLGDELPGAAFAGAVAGDGLSSVSSAGDVNGDGIGDFLIGAPGADLVSVQADVGRAYLIFGRKFVID